jgi:aspartate kinase
MEQIRSANIALRLKNVKNPSGSGTIIYPSRRSGTTPPRSDPDSHPETPVTPPNPGISSFMSENGYYGETQSRRAPTALTSKDSIVLISVQCDRQKKSHGFLAQVFGKLNLLDTVAYLVTSTEQSVSLALSTLDTPGKVERIVESLGKCGKVEVSRDMAIVSVVGNKMRNMIGIAGEYPSLNLRL